MAKPKATERLRAPLMYAFRSAAAARDSKKKIDLRNEEGERVLASRRATSTGRRSLSDSALKALLSEDLVALLNTVNLDSAAPELIGDLHNVQKSILNFGLQDMANKTIDERERIDGIKDDLLAAIKEYEPRLISRSMRVMRDEANEDDLTIRFVVSSDMRADPVPTSVEFVTEVELDSGDIKINQS
ncbi:MAG: type VI secretion system baseplate subunit TssE [Pseudomonadota bacterium]